MSQTEHKSINKIIAISAAVLALVLLLLYMQGSFVSKVEPGLSPLANGSTIPKSDAVVVEKKQVGNILTWPGTVRSRTVANIAPRMTARITRNQSPCRRQSQKGRCHRPSG